MRWVPHSGRFDPGSLHPVEGGREDNNTPLFVAHAHAKEHQGILGFGGGGKEGLYPGKCSEVLDKAFVTVGDKEVGVSVSFSLATHSVLYTCVDLNCLFLLP